jgi:hypothetical protein
MLSVMALLPSSLAIDVGDNKFSISIAPNRAADSLAEWLRKNIRAMAARPRYHDQTMPRVRRVSETEMKQKHE